jgi:hypothetical protein
MLVAVVLFVVMDALGKYLSLRYPVIQVVWARYAFHLLAMAPILLHPRVTVLTNRLGLQLLRSMCLLGTTFLPSSTFHWRPPTPSPLSDRCW